MIRQALHRLAGPCFRVAGDPHVRDRVLAEMLDDGVTLDDALRVLAETDPLQRARSGTIASIPPEDVYAGALAGVVMLPFLRPFQHRFNDATFGAWYAGDQPETSAIEKGFHLARHLRASAGESYEVSQRIVSARIREPLSNVRRGSAGVSPAVYDPDPARYASANALGRALRDAGAHGLYYDSVRRDGHQCVAVYRPRIVADVTLLGRVRFSWNRAEDVLERYLEI